MFVNDVELTSAAPYWQNGSATAAAAPPAGGWNAYFDAAASSLTLRDAVIDTMHVWSNPEEALVYANGDVTVTLLGYNNLQHIKAATNQTIWHIGGWQPNHNGKRKRGYTDTKRFQL